MRNSDPADRNSQLWLAAIFAVMLVVGLVIYVMSDPSNRMATPDNPSSAATSTAPKSPPASTPADPATQGSSR